MMNEEEFKGCPFTHVFKDFGHSPFIYENENGLWRVGCNCGYRSSLMATPEQAVRCHTELLDMRNRPHSQEQEIDRLRNEWETPDENTLDCAPVWCRNRTAHPQPIWSVKKLADVPYLGDYKSRGDVVLAKEGQGPPPDDWQPQEEKGCLEDEPENLEIYETDILDDGDR